MKITILKLTEWTGTVKLFQVTRKRSNSKKFETVTPISFKEGIKVSSVGTAFVSSDTNNSILLRTYRRVYDFSVASYNLDVEKFYEDYSWELSHKEYEEYGADTAEIRFDHDLELRMIYDEEDVEVFKDFAKNINKEAGYHCWDYFRQDAFEFMDTILKVHYKKFVNPENVEIADRTINIKKDKKVLAEVAITTAFWSDLKVLGELFSKLEDVQKVADLINGLEQKCALSSNLKGVLNVNN